MPYTIVRIDPGWRGPCGAPIKAFDFRIEPDEITLPRIAMLLRNDFDSAITRQCLFRHEPRFAFKLVLLNRIKWFDGPSSPSNNHAWFVWIPDNEDPPTIRYIGRGEAMR